MNKTLKKLGEIGIVPVIKIDDAAKAVPLAKALIAGGIPCAEVTFRTAAAAEAITRINAECPDILLGAGTVLSTEQVDKAVAAGAKYIVTPGYNPKVVDYCLQKGLTVAPGCSGPSDMEKAIEAGLDTVKFFPAEQAGGLDFIKAVAGPYTTLKFMPTGGINASNIGTYLANEKIHACGGSWMVPADLINAGNFDAITALCKEAVAKALKFTLAHVGINAENEEAALKAARTFETIFGFTNKIGNSSIFAAEHVEIMKSPYLGKYGHIGIGTLNVARAKAHLLRRGIAFNEQSQKLTPSGDIGSVYFAEEIGGFAVHLVKKV